MYLVNVDISSGNTGHGTQFLLVSTLSTEKISTHHTAIAGLGFYLACVAALCSAHPLYYRGHCLLLTHAAFPHQHQPTAPANSSRAPVVRGATSATTTHSEAADHAHSSGC